MRIPTNPGTLCPEASPSAISSSNVLTWCHTCPAPVQVKYLEGFIVFVTVALAVGIGFCCMHIINTPTRFETPKDQRAGAHHD